MHASLKRRLAIGRLPQSVFPRCDPTFAIDRPGQGQVLPVNDEMDLNRAYGANPPPTQTKSTDSTKR